MTAQSWQMLCSKQSIIARNNLYSYIREFFKVRDVLEVETPLLSSAAVTDPYINSFEVNGLYLQTSPEFAMKRMLCSGIGSIFQICKAFRAEECGRHHNIEFTMLEWYRIGFKLEDLMAEMAELLTGILELKNSAENILKISYQELFEKYLDFNYHLVDSKFLSDLISKKLPGRYTPDVIYSLTKDDLLTILLSDYIEPNLDKNKLVFLYDYPSTQAALARVDKSSKFPVAKRFEVYYQGLELANGFYELADYQEQSARFTCDLAKRAELGFALVKQDNNLIAALKHGLPECSGVALGLDRLLMLKLGFSDIKQVITFGA
jgi:lysyl-tRNA synthetase class 2